MDGSGADSVLMKRFYRRGYLIECRATFIDAAKSGRLRRLRNARVRGQCAGLAPVLAGQGGGQVRHGLRAAQQPDRAVSGRLARQRLLVGIELRRAAFIGGNKVHRTPGGGPLAALTMAG